MGLDPFDAAEVERVAVLHDVGKLTVAPQILDHRGPLTPEQRVVILRHTIEGAELLASTAGLEHLAGAVRATHERWDGTGYPDGLAGPGHSARRPDRGLRGRLRRHGPPGPYRPALPRSAGGRPPPRRRRQSLRPGRGGRDARRPERLSGQAGTAGARAASPGGWISRLRILPVGPLGSSSTNQIWRGYL